MGRRPPSRAERGSVDGPAAGRPREQTPPVPLVLSRAQALAEGRTAVEVDALVRSGRWRSLHRGIYLTVPDLPDDGAHRHACLVVAACLATSTACVGSHTSAAQVHGLPLLRTPAGPPVLTRLRTAAGSEVARLVSDVPADHRGVVLEAPVTTLPRTAVDLARGGIDDLEAAVVLDAALRRASRAELEQVLAHQRGWPGSARARVRLARADGRVESPLESVGRLRFAQLGLPVPELQVLVGGREGPIGRVDFLWPEQRTVGEADGRLKYRDPRDLYLEKRREDDLRDAGLEVFRFGWYDALHRPERLRERALQAFARARRRAA